MSAPSSSRLGAQLAAALASGALFGVGLVVSGMADPAKVIGFLDVGGGWDPSLALVMGAALAVHILASRVVVARGRPLFAERFALPTRRDVDVRLVVGAAIFGVGWGLGGFCPGPGLVAGTTAGADALAFVGAMALASYVTARLDRR